MRSRNEFGMTPLHSFGIVICPGLLRRASASRNDASTYFLILPSCFTKLNAQYKKKEPFCIKRGINKRIPNEH